MILAPHRAAAVRALQALARGLPIDDRASALSCALDEFIDELRALGVDAIYRPLLAALGDSCAAFLALASQPRIPLTDSTPT